MRIAYFDCFSGISGDMVLGAMIDAGLDPQQLCDEIAKLGRPDISLTFSTVQRHAIKATRAKVLLETSEIQPTGEHHIATASPEEEQADHVHRKPKHQESNICEHDQEQFHEHDSANGINTGIGGINSIAKLISESRLDPEVKDGAVAIFKRLYHAEATVHGVKPEAVRLHEVGTIDAVVDVVGAVAGLRLLGVDYVHSSPLRLGTGFVQCAHGRYPVPVPGVLELCHNVPTEQTDIQAELVTPTGAAIITHLAHFEAPPPTHQEAVGYGAGRRNLEALPNLLRLRIGTASENAERDRLVLIEANIDDMNPEIYSYLFDLLLNQGAKDVYVTPIHMKKGRPAQLLSVLSEVQHAEGLGQTLLAETTTIGVRFHEVERLKLKRRSDWVETNWGKVRLKIVDTPNGPRSAPEYEDCARLARRYEVPLQAVYTAAQVASHSRGVNTQCPPRNSGRS